MYNKYKFRLENIKYLLVAVLWMVVCHPSWAADRADKEVVKILAIGNSFSEDAVEHYLYGLAKAGGKKIVIGNLHIGGAPLDLHWKNAEGDKAVYSYRKISLSGEKVKTIEMSIAKALGDEDWDFISVQQASAKSGLWESYTRPLPLLMAYIRQHATNPKVKYIFHQTWAYAQDSQHKAFTSYGSDQQQMYQAIMKASTKAKALGGFDLLVPVGTAIQNARNSYFGDKLCRDGHHLDLNIGRYIASCTWYEVIFGETVEGNPCRPAKVNEKEALMGQKAAHLANLSPYQVTANQEVQ